MNQHTLSVLEFSHVLELLAGYTQSAAGHQKLIHLTPQTDLKKIQQKRGIYEDMIAILHSTLSLPGFFADDLHEILVRCAPQESALDGLELVACLGQLETVREVRKFLLQEACFPYKFLYPLGQSLHACEATRSALLRCLDSDGTVLDSASEKLRQIRRDLFSEERKIQRALDNLIKNPDYDDVLQDHFVTVRNGRYVVPVKRDAKNQLQGFIHDQSNSGQTLFVEPGAILNMGNNLATLHLQERDEIRKILSELSGQIRSQSAFFRENQEIISELDAASAIAHWAVEYGCILPSFGGTMELHGARHPILLEQFKSAGTGRAVVPLDLSLPRGCKVLAVTGSNTGGKTVILKTVGLLALLAQSGLPVPVGDGSLFLVYDTILADIGDEQSLQENLSTFSAHIKNIADLIRAADAGKSLILLDELGSGTDPLEGGAIACGVLQELARKKGLTIATTHLGMVKNYVHTRADMINAAVRFNTDTFQPQYTLDIGRPGASHALLIARRLGMPSAVLNAAEKMMSEDHVRIEDVLAKMEADQHKLSSRAEQAQSARDEVVRDRAVLQKELSTLKQERKKLLFEASSQAEAMVQDSQKELENLLRELKENASSGAKDVALNRNAEIIRQKLKTKHEDLTKKRVQNAPVPEKPIGASQLEVGKKVWVRRLNAHGVVEKISAKKKQIRVQVKGLSFDLKMEDLEYSRESEKNIAKPPSVQVIMPHIEGGTSHEINIIGMRVEEALSCLEVFLNQAILAHLGEVRIVHGFGTGRLRNGVQSWLKQQKYVSHFHTGQEGKDSGSGGVTIVKLS